MSFKKGSFLILLAIIKISVFAQLSSIKGKVYDISNNQAVPFANIIVGNTSWGAVADTNGNYSIQNVPPGVYNITCKFVGYKSFTQYEVR